jgi:hypothetical protein
MQLLEAPETRLMMRADHVEVEEPLSSLANILPSEADCRADP